MKKQLTALVLCICMVLSVLPFSSTQATSKETSSVEHKQSSMESLYQAGKLLTTTQFMAHRRC